MNADTTKYFVLSGVAYLVLGGAVDIEETEKERVIKAELPGVEKKDVCVQFRDGVRPDTVLILATRSGE